MRYMMFVQIPADLGADAWQPSADEVGEMGRYNEELLKAGVMLSGEGLLPPEHGGARLEFSDDGVTVTDGPFAEAKEVVGGFWIIDVKSHEEAIEWARRCPSDVGVLELRRIAEMEDFPEDVQEASRLSQTPPEQTSSRD